MSNNIEDIQRRYWQGETTLEEERLIKRHYNNGTNNADDISAKYLQYVQIEQQVKMQKALKKPVSKLVSLRRIMSIAASVALVAMTYFLIPDAKPLKTTNEITDPQVALEITREALSLIGGKMDKSETMLREGVAQFDKTYINKIL